MGMRDFHPNKITSIIHNNVFFLGRAKDGPLRTPVRITSYDKAVKLFGADSDMVEAYLVASTTSPTNNYYLVRVSGEYAKATMQYTSSRPVVFRSVYAGDKYNGITVSVEDAASIDSAGRPITRKALRISPSPALAAEGKGTLVYFLDMFESCGHLIERVNTDTDLGIGTVYILCDLDVEPTYTLPYFSMTLSGGADGCDLSKNQLYEALEQTYEVLLGREVDVVCPLGAYFDDVQVPSVYGYAPYGQSQYMDDGNCLTLTNDQGNYVTFHGQLARFCRQQQRFGNMSLGVIGMKPVKDVSRIGSWPINYVVNIAQNTAFADRFDFSDVDGGVTVDLGMFLSVVCGEVIYESGLKVPGSVPYAALLASTLPGMTTTNMSVGAGTKQTFELGGGAIDRLSELGVVAFRTSPKRGLVVAKGVTAALTNTVYHFIENARTAQALSIGMNNIVNEITSRYSLSTALVTTKVSSIIRVVEEMVSSFLSALKSIGALDDYDYEIDASTVGMLVVKIKAVVPQSVDYITGSAFIRLLNGG